MEKLSGSRGSAFLDVLIAILIGSASLLVVFGGIALAARTTAQAQARVLQIVTDHNEKAKNRPIQFVEQALR